MSTLQCILYIHIIHLRKVTKFKILNILKSIQKHISKIFYVFKDVVMLIKAAFMLSKIQKNL